MAVLPWLRGALGGTCAAALLAACAVLPSAVSPAAGFEVIGRVAVRYGSETASGRVSWRHAAAFDELLISTPLGQGVAEITRRDGIYTLITPGGRPVSATDPESLTEQALGWRLPLAGLPDWVRGRARAGVLADTDLAGDGRPAEIRQLGWTIEYVAFDEATGLPSRLRLRRENLDIRLAIDTWAVAR